MRSLTYIFIFSLLALTFFGCKQASFSFQSGSLHPDVKTITIRNYQNESSGGPPNVDILFTETLKEYFQQNTKLTLVPDNGDIILEGYINNYSVSPLAPKADETAALNRLTIGIKTQYQNAIETNEKKKSFDKQFSFYADFEQGKALSDVEDELIEEIFDQIVIDIYNSVVSGDDW